MHPDLIKLLQDATNQHATDAELTTIHDEWMAAHPLKLDIGTRGEGDPSAGAGDVSGTGAPPATSKSTDPSVRNLLRSFTQGATFGFGDEMGVTDRDKEDAFKKEHPWMDMGAKFVGGAIAPIAAIAAAPEALAGVGGAALIGGASGLLSGIGEGTDAKSRVKGGLLGGAVGGALGAGGTLLAKGATSGIVGLLNRANPGRAVATAAAKLITAETAARMAAIEELAPGGSSIATATVPAVGSKVSRFASFARAIGKGTNGAQAEADIVGQLAALDAGQTRLGAQMDKLATDVPVSGRLRDAMGKVREILKGKTPEMPEADVYKTYDGTAPKSAITTAQSPHPQIRDAIDDFWRGPGIAYDRTEGTVAQQMARQSLERHGAEAVVSPSLRGAPSPEPGPIVTTTPETVPIQVMRDALSRLRYLVRNAAKRGTEADGATLHDINEAKNALQEVLYDKDVAPGFKELDKNFSMLKDEQRQADRVLKIVQLSRSNHAANEAVGSTAGSLGGSLPKGAQGIALSLAEKAFTNKPGAADAIARLITKPGGPEMVNGLLKLAPGAVGRGPAAVTSGLLTSLPNSMRGLLSNRE